MTTEMAFLDTPPSGSTVDEAPPDVWFTNLNDQHADGSDSESAVTSQPSCRCAGGVALASEQP
jgi:hypothetical protein